MVDIQCGRCAKCGGQESVAYDAIAIQTRTESGTVRPGWQAVVVCTACGAQRIYKADRITDFRLRLDVIPTRAKGGETDAGDDGGAVQPS